MLSFSLQWVVIISYQVVAGRGIRVNTGTYIIYMLRIPFLLQVFTNDEPTDLNQILCFWQDDEDQLHQKTLDDPSYRQFWHSRWGTTAHWTSKIKNRSVGEKQQIVAVRLVYSAVRFQSWIWNCSEVLHWSNLHWNQIMVKSNWCSHRTMGSCVWEGGNTEETSLLILIHGGGPYFPESNHLFSQWFLLLGKMLKYT